MANPNSLIGRQLDQFRLDQYIAKGAMGTVFKAFDTVLIRTVALKLIDKNPEGNLTDQEVAMSEEARKRLIQEAKAAGRLTHPNIVTIHAYGETDEFGYICMEYVPGKTLADLLKEEKVLSADEAKRILEQILLALEAASKEQIVHRDIKPSNIMLTEDSRVKVMDFGIAKLPSFSMTITGTVLGTPYYMSPEQIMGQKVDIRSDLFSVGAVLYQMLTGERPFQGESTSALTYKIVNVEPVPPTVLNVHVPKSLANLIRKALSKDPSERYQTPAEMLKDLRATMLSGENAPEPATEADTTVISGKDAPVEPPAPREPAEKKKAVQAVVAPPREEKKDPEPAPAPPKEKKPPSPPATKKAESAPVSAPPPRVTSSSGLKVFAICTLLILFLAAGAILGINMWHERLRTASPPATTPPVVQQRPTQDTQSAVKTPDVAQQVPSTTSSPPPATQAPVEMTQPPPQTVQQYPDTVQQPNDSTQRALQQPSDPSLQSRQNIPEPPAVKSPVTPPPVQDFQLEKGYFVRGVNPNGKSYKGTAVIERRGSRYTLTWKIAKDTFTGSGTLSGDTLTVNWKGSSGGGGVVVYKVDRGGTLKGVWADGKGTETLVPIR